MISVDFADVRLSQKDGHAWSIGGRLGVLSSPSTLLFVSAGWTQVSTEADLSFVFGGTERRLSLDKERDGWFVGAGIETQLGWLGSGFSLRGEYRFTRLDDDHRRLTLEEGCGLEQTPRIRSRHRCSLGARGAGLQVRAPRGTRPNKVVGMTLGEGRSQERPFSCKQPFGEKQQTMATTYYRGYRIWHDRTHRKFFAVIWPPGSVLAILKIINVTPREGECVLLRRARALSITETALGPDHPEVGNTLNNLAGLYRAQGRYAEAVSLCERALAIAQTSLGVDHPDVGGSLNNLAALRYEQKDWAQAAQFWQRSAAIISRRVQRGADNVGRAVTGKHKSEAERWSWQFWGLVKAVQRIAPQERGIAIGLGRCSRRRSGH